jgi:hypothetical protein
MPRLWPVDGTLSFAILRARRHCGAPEFRTFKAEHQLARGSGSAYDGVTE